MKNKRISYYTNPPEQSVYAAPSHYFDLPVDELSVTQGTLFYEDDQKKSPLVKLLNGETHPLIIQHDDHPLLYLGRILNPDEEVSWFVFTSKQNLLDYREWSILSNMICNAHCKGTLYCENPTRQNLSYCRVVYDIITGKPPVCQELSCGECINAGKKDRSGIVACHGCARNGYFSDRWEGSSKLPSPFIYGWY